MANRHEATDFLKNTYFNWKRHCFLLTVVFLISVIAPAIQAEESARQPLVPDNVLTEEVLVRESTLAVMARHLKHERDLLRRDFANITLLTMLRTYVEELDKTTLDAEEPSAKVSRWYRATSDYIDRIGTAQRFIDFGHPFTLEVTREGWVLIIVEGIPTLISGPKISDGHIASVVKSEYCRYHDCGWLRPEKVSISLDKQPVEDNRETWIFDKRLTPTLEIEGRFQFVFKNFKDKTFKQEVARKAMAEIKLFLSEVKRAKLNGYYINWELLSLEVPSAGVDQSIFLNTGDVYLRIALPVISYLNLADWQTLIEWLKWTMSGNDVKLVIHYADVLLEGVSVKQGG